MGGGTDEGGPVKSSPLSWSLFDGQRPSKYALSWARLNGAKEFRTRGVVFMRNALSWARLGDAELRTTMEREVGTLKGNTYGSLGLKRTGCRGGVKALGRGRRGLGRATEDFCQYAVVNAVYATAKAIYKSLRFSARAQGERAIMVW